MHAIHIKNPPLTHSDEPIDITPSLDYIKEMGDNLSMTIRDLTIKTSFLLALVTASRPSDLRKVNLTTMKDLNTSYSKSHSLTTSKSPTKKIYVGRYNDDPFLCPYNALQFLLSRTRSWRDNQKKQEALFLITKPPHTPAATDTIAGWIKTVIKMSAKDMRSLSAFFLQNAGGDISTILALGNWFSNTTYQRFYQRGIKLMLERNQVSKLILDSATTHN
ncbi:10656_t:CDS:2 [Funneliformis caledonium]|uniref:10656_t:CDS:1 n=1 Tax=Funneliformis caledonium TaxID=1117310 RepID=A0A9N8YNL6_9GLOM|nr:10656_t:CDS:2 [Funneliformis caledonium]